MNPTDDLPLGASFRDPCGYVFRRGEEIYRCVNASYAENYAALFSSGLYEELVKEGLLVPHSEAELERAPAGAFKVLRPERIPFISYPYEWSFSQLKDAALATLRVQRLALARGLSLKDASAYNIQFRGGRPVLIDTLSFEKLTGKPWVAYSQFCRHFLAPLALMAARDIRLGQLLRVHLDGVPLDLASRLLPAGTWLRPSLLLHVHLHARSGRLFSGGGSGQGKEMSRASRDGLLESLEGAVRGLRWTPAGTEWADYYNNTNYSGPAFESKKRTVAAFLEKCGAGPVWDLGANDGTFSRLAGASRDVVAFDMDPAAVELNYLKARAEKGGRVLPLLLDLRNPSGGAGWANLERASLGERGPAGTVLALALIHHLCIGNNLPFGAVSKFLAGICGRLVIEFVPKTDSKARQLLAHREDVFPGYTRAEFEKDFSAEFEIEESAPVTGSERVIYLMRSRRPPVSRQAEPSQA